MSWKHVAAISALAVATGTGVAATAHAEVLKFAPHERTITTADGWDLSVRLEGEDWNRVPTTNMTGTSREGYGTLRAVVNVGGHGSSLKGVQVQVGYIIGCFADLNNVTVGLQGSVGPQAGIEAGFPVPVVPKGQITATLTPTIGASVAPGEIKVYGLAQKNLEATEGVLQIREAHMNIDGCIGPAQVRAFASVTIDSKIVKDGTTVYGDTFPI
ncbi:MspA family porin [Nocardia aurea]|uniref:MspA family porin n=1 Tax=Nocardia aurea TaxID=2144174 RepID=UPI00339FC0CF